MLCRLPLALLCALLLSLPLGCGPGAEAGEPGGGAGSGGVGGEAGAGPGGSGGAGGTAGTGGAGGGGAGGEGGTGGEVGRPAPVPTIVPERLVIQPGGGRAFLLDALAAAERSVRVVAYIITDDAIEDALAATARRGIEVRAIVPASMENNREARSKLAAAGIPLRDGNPAFALTHQKSVVVDDELAFVLNQNLSYSGFEFNREYNAVVRGQPARDVAAIFDADWEERPWTGQTDLVLSPTNSRARLDALLRAAETRIDIAMEVMNDLRTIELVAALARTGVAVRVLLEDPAQIPFHVETARMLGQAGADVRWLDTPNLHAKAVVVDGLFAYIGSVNLTHSSLDRNREVGLVTADPEAVGRILSTFEADFALGRTDF